MHGYDSPWPAGGGKNLLQITARTGTNNGVNYTVNKDNDGNVISVVANGTPSGTHNSIFLLGTIPAGTYILSGSTGGSASKYYLLTSNGEAYSYNGDSSPFTISAEREVYIRVVNGFTAFNVVFQPMIRLATETDATFAPYSNICPISGHTGAEIEQAGINVWDEEWEVGGIRSNDGQNIENTIQIRSKNYIPIKPGTTYYCYFGNPVGGSNLQSRFYDINKNYIGYVDNEGNAIDKNSYFVTPYNACYLRFQVQNDYGATYNHDISINYPATDTTYHPYTGNQIFVNWEDEAGTVYGGTLTLNPDRTGELTVDRNVVQIPTSYWNYNSSLALFWSRRNNNPILANLASPIVGGYDVICSAYKHFNGIQYANIADGEFSVGLSNYSAQEPFVILRDTRFTTIEDFRASSGIENVSFEIPLDTPQTYQLTAEQVSGILTALDGTNVIWANTGDVTVTYIAKSAKFSFDSPLHIYNYNNLKLFGNTYIEHGKG